MSSLQHRRKHVISVGAVVMTTQAPHTQGGHQLAGCHCRLNGKQHSQKGTANTAYQESEYYNATPIADMVDCITAHYIIAMQQACLMHEQLAETTRACEYCIEHQSEPTNIAHRSCMPASIVERQVEPTDAEKAVRTSVSTWARYIEDISAARASGACCNELMFLEQSLKKKLESYHLR